MVASHRLGVKPAVLQIIVFRPANRAHRKGRHGGSGPVIREIPDNGEPGTTVCAIDQGIIDPMDLGFHIVQTLRTHGDIRTDLGNGSGNITAFSYLEDFEGIERDFL